MRAGGEHLLTFDGFRLADRVGPLLLNGEEVPLGRKATALLWHLGTHPGQSVSKEALLKAVWSRHTASDASLAVCIGELRAALGDNPKQPRYIKTVHGFGYRFLTTSSYLMKNAASDGFFGRDAELRKLDQMFENAMTGLRQVMFVSGEAGIGKSRLINAWLENLDSSYGAIQMVGNCADLSGAGEAYLPYLNALGSLTNRSGSEHVSDALRRVAPNWLARFPKLVTKNDRDLLLERTRLGDDKSMRREFNDLLVELSTYRPIILFLEDMHWSDPSSAILLGQLARSSQPAKLMVVATSRQPAPRDTTGEIRRIRGELLLGRYCNDLSLAPLPQTATTGYLSWRLGLAPDAPVAEAVHKRTRGHPLFVVALAEEILRTSNTQMSVAEVDQVIADDFVTFIDLKLADLKPEERGILEAASIAGETFDVAAIKGALAEIEKNVDDILSQLAERTNLIKATGMSVWPDTTRSCQYSFVHTFYPELIRQRLPAVRRAALHTSIGRRLEKGYGEQVKEIASLLAYHFKNGSDFARAIKYLQLAAVGASSRRAYEGAARLLREGLALIPKLPEGDEKVGQELELLLALGPTLISLEGYGAKNVANTFERAKELTEFKAFFSLKTPVLRGLAGLYHLRADYKRAHDLGSELIAQEDPNRSAQLEGHLIRGVTQFFRGNDATSSREIAKTIKIYDEDLHHHHCHTHGLDPRAFAKSVKALLVLKSGDQLLAERVCEEAIHDARKTDHPFTIAQCNSMAAFLYQWANKDDNAATHAQTALEIAEKHAFHYLVASETARLGWVMVRAGDAEAGIKRIEAGIDQYEQTDATAGLTAIMTSLAEAYLLTCEPALGIEKITVAKELMAANSERFFEEEILSVESQLLALQAKPSPFNSSHSGLFV